MGNRIQFVLDKRKDLKVVHRKVVSLGKVINAMELQIAM